MGALNISGITTTIGGTYENVSVGGLATINGDLTCEDLLIEGIATLNGKVNAQNATIRGVCTISNALNCAKIKIEGTCTINVKLHAEEVNLSGLLTHNGDIEAEKFCCNGVFKISGSINADEINVILATGGSAKELCGHNIKIRKSSVDHFSAFLEILPWTHKKKFLETDTIEGDIIDIEYTTAKIVRGKNVVIGQMCRVETVEYHDTLVVDPSAIVGVSKKIEKEG